MQDEERKHAATGRCAAQVAGRPLEPPPRDVAQRPDPPDAFAAPGDVHPQHDRAAETDAHPEAAAVVQLGEVDVAFLGHRLAGVHERRHLEAAEHIPAVLERRHEGVVVVEPVLVEAAQVEVAAELRQQIERDDAVVAAAVGEPRLDEQGDDALLIEVREECCPSRDSWRWL